MNTFAEFCKARETSLADAETSDVAELDKLLGRFYAEVRKQNGDYYAKKSLQSVRYGLQKHFEGVRNVDIVKDKEFKHSNLIYKSMLVKLKKMGKARVQHKPVIHAEDLKTMYSSLDQTTPRGLQNKVFLDYMLHFANRGRENLRDMTKQDLKVCTDPSGLRYVELTADRLTKTERGHGKEGPGQSGLMYETPDNPIMCPVSSFEKYICKLHPDSDCFWQRPKAVAKGSIWYDNMPVGKNTLYNKTRDILQRSRNSPHPIY